MKSQKIVAFVEHREFSLLPIVPLIFLYGIGQKTSILIILMRQKWCGNVRSCVYLLFGETTLSLHTLIFHVSSVTDCFGPIFRVKSLRSILNKQHVIAFYHISLKERIKIRRGWQSCMSEAHRALTFHTAWHHSKYKVCVLFLCS